MALNISNEFREKIIAEILELRKGNGSLIAYVRKFYDTEEEVQACALAISRASRGLGIGIVAIYRMRKILSDDIVRRCAFELSDSKTKNKEVRAWIEAETTNPLPKLDDKERFKRKLIRQYWQEQALFYDMKEAEKEAV